MSIYLPSTLRYLLLAMLLLGPRSVGAQAAGGPSFGLRPVRYDPDRPATQSYFIYDVSPGQSFQDEVQVTNSGSASGTVRLYPVDATTGQTSGPVYLSAADVRKGVGAWIELDQTELTLAPGESRAVAFKIRVPQSARPGQHLGGLVAEDTVLKEGQSGGALQVKLQQRMVTAVQINLPGVMVEKVEITGVASSIQAGNQVLELGLRNDGTEMVKPSGSVHVTNAQGQEVQRLNFQLESILPDTQIQYPVQIERQALAAGEYHATVRISYGKQGTASYETTFQVTNGQVSQLYEAKPQLPPPTAPVATAAVQPSQMERLLPGLIMVIAATLLFIAIRRRRSHAKDDQAGAA